MSRRDVEPAAHPARLHDAVERHRLAHALQHLRPAVLDHEQPADQALRRGGDHHRVGLGRALHARRDVRRLAEDLAAVGDHHRPGVHADAHGQARPVAGGEGGVERHHRVDDRQAGAHRPFRVVLARRGPAEVDEQPIAEVLGDVAAEARDGAGGGLLVLRDEVAPLLGVELLRERRRADQVAEEHRQLAALADFGGRGRQRLRWSGKLRRSLWLGRERCGALRTELCRRRRFKTAGRAAPSDGVGAFAAELGARWVFVLALRTPHAGRCRRFDRDCQRRREAETSRGAAAPNGGYETDLHLLLSTAAMRRSMKRVDNCEA